MPNLKFCTSLHRGPSGVLQYALSRIKGGRQEFPSTLHLRCACKKHLHHACRSPDSAPCTTPDVHVFGGSAARVPHCEK